MAVQGDHAATSRRSSTPLLDRISSPADLKTLPLSQLSTLAAEIRQEIAVTTSSRVRWCTGRAWCCP